MPIYEFRCENCGDIKEVLTLGPDEKFEMTCGACGGEKLSRVVSSCSSVITGGAEGTPSPSQGVENRSCADAGNCASITLPGHER